MAAEVSEPEHDVVIVGAGLQGVLATRRLASSGLNVLVLERRQGVGGVWASYANPHSRAQNHEPAYRMGLREAPQDYTERDRLVAELRLSLEQTRLTGRFRFGREVVKVVDEPEEPFVRVVHRATQPGPPEEYEVSASSEWRRQEGEIPLEQLTAGSVIFCTGTLQVPRNITFPGEDIFGGPVVVGLAGRAEQLDVAGKRVAVLGMGAFAHESAREALLKGAAKVELVTRNKLLVHTRFSRVVGIMANTEYSSHRDRATRAAQASRSGRGRQESPVPWLAPHVPEDPTRLVLAPYFACGAQSAMPESWHLALSSGYIPNPWASDSGTNISTSDAFFIAYALGLLEVHKGQVARLEPGLVVLASRSAVPSSSTVPVERKLRAHVIIKNLGFESPDPADLMGGVCELKVPGGPGPTFCCPPLWISPRVLTFRHCTEVAPLSEADWQFADELFNFVGSGTFASSAYLEIFLYYRERPQLLQTLLAPGGALAKLRKPVGEITRLDMSRGLAAAMAAGEGLQDLVNAQRRAVNAATVKRYAMRESPEKDWSKEWLYGFLEQNRRDWEDLCQRLAGEPKAVPYVWETARRAAEAELIHLRSAL